MASLIEKAKVALGGGVSHEIPAVKHTRKILLAVTGAQVALPSHRTGFHWSELMDAYEVFVKHGWDVDIVSESGTAAPDEASITNMASALEKKKWEDKKYHLHRKLAEIRPASQVNAAQYCAMYFAGGHACCVDFPTALELKKLAAQIYENGGVLGAVCHGPAIFQNLKLSSGKSLIEGREVTGFSARGEKEMKLDGWLSQHNYLTMEDTARREGGIWKEIDGDCWKEFTVVSERIITGVNPASAKTVADKMLAYLPKDETKPGMSAAPSAAAIDKTSVGGTGPTVKTDAAGSSSLPATAAGAKSAELERSKEATTYAGERGATTTTTTTTTI